MRRPSLPILAMFATSVLSAAEPAVGDTRIVVEAELGKPTATRTTPAGEQVSVYPRGSVTYRDGRVTELKIVSGAEWQKRLDDVKRAEDEARKRAERLAADRARRLDEANKARDTLIASEEYKHLSPEGKINRLDQLIVRYPEAEIAPLREDLSRNVLDAKKRAEADRAAKEAAERRAEDLSRKLDEAVRALTLLADRAEALEKRLAQSEKDMKDMGSRMSVMENIVRTRITSPGEGVSFTPGVTVGGGHSDSGPSH